jgi:hypothetical protein
MRAVPIGDTVAISDGSSAKPLDLADDFLRRREIAAAGAADRAAKIVDHDRRARARHVERNAAADASAASGDESDLAFHAAGHEETPVLLNVLVNRAQ